MDTQIENYWLKAPTDEMAKTEVKAGAAFVREMLAEMGSGREIEIASLQTELKTDTAVGPICEHLTTESSSLPEDIQKPPSDRHSGEEEDAKPGDPSAPQKPSLSYIALIAKVILSSSSQKLNLTSIYREIEERFPYFRSRRQGQSWRNSVRHNLSLNDCFVKVSRCEDGKGHYWGIHPAHLGDFLLGDFRQHRKARRSRQQREMQERVAAGGSFGWVEPPHYNWERFCGSGLGPVSCVEPQCPLRETRQYQTGCMNWTGPHDHFQGRNGSGAGPLGWLRPYYCPERFENSYDRAVGTWCYSHPVTPTWRLHSWQTHDPTMNRVEGSYDNNMSVRPHSFYSPSGCQYRAPIFNDMI